MSSRIGLFYNRIDGKVVGCRKVIENLLAGLSLLGVEVVHNSILPKTGCLQGVDAFHKKKLSQNALIGPEIMVLPNEMPWSWPYYKNWVQPSQWVVDYMRTFDHTKNVSMDVWPVGINTDEFNDGNRGKFTKDCFIYYKTVTNQVDLNKLKDLQRFLSQNKISSEVITYGNYQESKYKQLLNTCKFGIFLTGTESQGIAYMEALSSGVPLYVIDINEFFYKRQNYKFIGKNVSAAPYFDDRCGIKCPNLSRLLEFVEKKDTYAPREYILENHTLKMGAKKYVDILNRC